MTIIDIIKARKPSPQARGEGIRAAKAYRETTAGLLFDRLIAEMVADIWREMDEPLDHPQFAKDSREDLQRNREVM